MKIWIQYGTISLWGGEINHICISSIHLIVPTNSIKGFVNWAWHPMEKAIWISSACSSVRLVSGELTVSWLHIVSCDSITTFYFNLWTISAQHLLTILELCSDLLVSFWLKLGEIWHLPVIKVVIFLKLEAFPIHYFSAMSTGGILFHVWEVRASNHTRDKQQSLKSGFLAVAPSGTNGEGSPAVSKMWLGKVACELQYGILMWQKLKTSTSPYCDQQKDTTHSIFYILAYKCLPGNWQCQGKKQPLLKLLPVCLQEMPVLLCGNTALPSIAPLLI